MPNISTRLGVDEDDIAKLTRTEVSDRQAMKLRDAVRDMLAGYPFLGSLASSDSIAYHPVTNVQFKLCATDAVGVYLNADAGGFFDDKWTQDHRLFCVAHEILHQVMESVLWKSTHKRMGFVPVPKSPTFPDGLAPFDDATWERAEDARINNALIADAVGTPPDGIYTNPSVTWNMDFGTAYATVYVPPNQQPPQPQQGPGPGQPPPPGSTPPPPGQQPYDFSDVLKPGQGGDPFSAEPDADTPQDEQRAQDKLEQGKGDREVRVKRAQNAARQAGVGASTVEQLIIAARAPGVDWRSYIPGFLARCAGNSAYDFRKPARPPLLRTLVGEDAFFAPGRAGHGCNVVVFVGDVSGSIGEDEHRAMLGHVAEMLEVLRPTEFIILWADDGIARVDRDVDTETDFSRYKIPRGGGTSFVPAFEWVERENLDIDGLVYFTDFYGAAPVQQPKYPVLWLSSTPLKAPQYGGGKWGEVLNVPMHELKEL